MHNLFTKTLLLFFLSLNLQALETVAYVDLNRYLGKWYEISRIDSWFENECTDVSAEYSLLANNRINVVNSCSKDNGRIHKEVHGRAWIVDKATNAKIKVSFLPTYLQFLDKIISGDYWILKIDNEYQVALVGDPSLKFLWVLSRNKKIDDNIYQEYVKYAQTQGYDISKLHKTLFLTE